MAGISCRRRTIRSGVTSAAALFHLILTLTILVRKSRAATACPGDCSGNGLCDAATTHCNCYETWTGHNCATRKCPRGPAWVSMPHEADDDVHSTASSHLLECSGVGDCSGGICVCSDPYAGSACERIKCPPGGALPCNGNGRCISLKEAGDLKDDVNLFNEISYNAWDAERIFGCLCDDSYTGYDCSLRKCPFGDDPSSGNHVDEIQKITCTATSGTFNVKLYGRLTRTLNFNDSPNDLKSALEELPMIRAVAVNSYDNSNSVQNVDSGVLCASGYYWLVTFTHVPGDIPDLVFPKEAVSGQPVYHSTTTPAETTSQECSGRGSCTRTGDSGGTCTCQSGYTSSDGAGGNAAGSAGDCASFTTAACPGLALTGTNCGGHGVCTSNVCTCDSDWTGYDCALRTCPKGHAWFDEPTATDIAHGLVECSGKGICNRGSGVCACQSGFEGTACDRTSCPTTNGATGIECNGRGRCMNLRTMATFREVNGVASPLIYGTVPGSAVTWDADKIMGCLCDQGRYDRNQYSWIGADCAFRECSRGDDMETDSAATGFYQAEVQKVTCAATSGTFTLGFRGSTTTAIAFNAQATGTNTTLAPTGTVTFGDSRLVTNSIDIQASIAAGDFLILQNSLGTEERIFKVLSNPTGATTDSSHGIVMTEPIGMTSGSDYVLYKIVTSVESALEALDTITDVTVTYDDYVDLAALTNTLSVIAGHATGGTTTNVGTSTTGSGSGLIATVITGSANPPTLTSVTVTTAGTGYKVGDMITFTGTGSGSAGNFESFNYVLVAEDFATGAACSAAGNAWKVTFHTEHSDVPDLIRTTSSLAHSGGSPSMNLVTSVVGTTEDEECSLHGTCDRNMGICSCDPGWTSSDGMGKYGTRGDCGALISSSSCQSSFCASTVRL